MSVWVNFATAFPSPWSQYILMLRDGNSDLYYFDVGNAGSSLLATGGPAGGGQQTITGSTLTTGTWIHLAMVLSNVGMASSNTLMTIYQNGVNKGTTSNIVPSGTSLLGTLYIATGNGTNSPFWGSMQDLRIYNSALSAAQIKGIYQSQGIPPRLTLTPSNAGLPALQYAWPFQNSVIDTVQGLYPASANVGGVPWNVWNSGNTWPYYDSVTPVYGTNSIVLNNVGQVSSNIIQYNFNIPFGGTYAYTISFWFNWITAPGSTVPYIFRTGVSGPSATNFAIGSGGLLQTSSTTNLSYGGQPSTPMNVPGTWYHVAIVNTSSTGQTYANGSPGTLGTSANPPVADSSNVFTGIVLAGTAGIGYSATRQANIEIGDLRIYNTALTPAQVKSIYQSGGNLYGASLVQPNYLWSLNGTLQETVTSLNPSGTTVTTTYVPGRNGQGLSSSGMYYNGGTSNPILPLLPLANGLTVSIWVYYTSSASGFLLDISSFNAAVNSTYRDRIYAGVNPVGFTVNATTGGFGYSYQNIPNVWNHYLFTFNSTSFLFYLNGNLVSTKVTPSSWPTTDAIAYFGGNVALGMLVNGSSGPPVGTIVNDWRFYNTFLTASQIQQIYQSGGAGPSGTMVQSAPQPSFLLSFNGTNVDSITGASPSTITGPPTYVTGLYGQAVNFPNTANGNPQTGYQLVYNPTPTFSSTTGLTLSYWVNFNVTGVFAQTQFVIYSTTPSSTNPSGSISIYLDGSTPGNLVLYPTPYPLITLGGGIIPKKWYHVAFTFINGTIVTYVNGSQTATGSDGNSTFAYLQLGGTYNQYAFNGALQDFRIYKSVLTASQILGIYQSGSAPPTALMN
jgi:hypothetical protein